MTTDQQHGPLAGVRVVEIAGIGPGPHACMTLADLGAEVIRVDRPGGQPLSRDEHDILNRGRPSIALDLKHPAGLETLMKLIEQSDILIEGMRPGVAERLGFGPDDALARNPRLVYGRMTGWGQDGPLASSAGHDINYIAITGSLHGSGQDSSRPHFPGNLLGDFGGGSMYLVVGVLAGLVEARQSGAGQVVDAAIVDGTAHLNAVATTFRASGELVEERASNLLDGGSAFYDVYETADGRHMAVGAIEPQFYRQLVDLLELTEDLPDRDDPDCQDALRRVLADAFARRTQAEWVALFEGTDACVSGVVPLSEAVDHPHLRARGVFVERDGVVQPAPAPRFSRTPGTLGLPPSRAGEHTRDVLVRYGIEDVDGLLASGVAHQA